MSDETPRPDQAKKRRRRRRRKPNAPGGEGSSQQGAGKPAAGGGGSRGEAGGRRGEGGSRGEAGGRREGGEGRRRRRRRRGGGGGEGEGAAQSGGGGEQREARDGAEAAQGSGGRSRRSRRGRGRDGDRDKGRGRGGERGRGRDTGRGRRDKPARKSDVQLSDAGGSMSHMAAAAPAPAPADDVDAGWDDVLPGGADRDPIAGLRSDPAINYGDVGDEDAEPMAVELAPDLPKNPPRDDLDPLTADADAEPIRIDRNKRVRNVVGVKFASAGKIYLFDGGEHGYRAGEEVIVESDRGPRLATVAVDSARAPNKQLKKILRRPDKNDRRNVARNEDKAKDVLKTARERARELKMNIKVFRAEHAHTGKRVRIYFTAEHRIDFRDLVRDLSRTLNSRVEMRQTGVRDQAKMVGGIGSCGRELCCTTWLPEFVPVSIKNAKDQGLVLNPTKVSGQCGRLKCCLVYEQALYSELRKGLPKMGKRVITPDGDGRVVEVDVLHQRIRVSLGHGEFKVYPANDVQRMFPAQQPNQPGSSKKTRSRKKKADGDDVRKPRRDERNTDSGATKPDSGATKPDGGATKTAETQPTATSDGAKTPPAGDPAAQDAPAPASNETIAPTKEPDNGGSES